MNKYVIYSILVGGYDDIRQPIVIDDRFDYVLFSDEHVGERIGVWQVRAIPYNDTNRLRLSRYAKCHPTKVLSDYQASLYMDANIRISTSWVYERFIEMLKSGIEWAGIKHPDQHCIYDEIVAITDLRWVRDFEVVEWYAKMKKAGFPENYGLYENNVIFRQHTNKVENVGDLWWKTLEKDCKRDQFSLMYVLWQVQLVMGFILSNRECPRIGSQHFAYYNHNPHKRVIKLGFHEMMRYRCIRTMYPNDIRKGYHQMFDEVSISNNPQKELRRWEWRTFIKQLPKLLYLSIKKRTK